MNTKPYQYLRVAALCVATTCAVSLFAQPDSTTGTPPSSMNSNGMAKSDSKNPDSSFMKKAAASGMKEVDISRVAQDRATDPQVKDFAQMMVSDHETANNELMAIAAAKGVALPEKDKSTDKWSKKNAKSFDKDYMKQMVSDHKEAVSLFTKESSDGKDPETRAFAMKYLPKLQQHLQKATDTVNMLK